MVLGIEPRALHTLVKCFTTKVYPQLSFCFLFWDRVLLSCVDWAWTHSVAQAGPELVNLQSQPSKQLRLKAYNSSPT